MEEMKKLTVLEPGAVYYTAVIYNDGSNKRQTRIMTFKDYDKHFQESLDFEKQVYTYHPDPDTKPGLGYSNFTWYYRLATQEEIQWLNECRKAGKYVDRDVLQSNQYEIY